jgi:hypothetical protein
MNALSGRTQGARQLSWTHHGQHKVQRCRNVRSSTPAARTNTSFIRSSIKANVSRNSFTSSSTQQQQQQQQSVLQRAFANPPQWGSFLGSLAVAGAVFGTALDGIHSRVGLQVSRRLQLMNCSTE